MASLRLHQALGTRRSSADPRGLQPFACHHQSEIPQGKHKSLVTFTAAWSTRTCFPPAACKISVKPLQTARRLHGFSPCLESCTGSCCTSTPAEHSPVTASSHMCSRQWRHRHASSVPTHTKAPAQQPRWVNGQHHVQC